MQNETERAEPETDAAQAVEQSEAGGEDRAAAPGDAERGDPAAAEAEDADEQEAAEPEELVEDEEAEGGDAALKEQLLRALADAENARRRAKKDVDDARNYAISRFAQDLLGVADNLGRALENIPADKRESDDAVKAIAEGIEMTAREFETDGTVVQVFQTGYRIGDRLLREAMVGVAKGGTQPATDDDTDTGAEAEAEAETGSDGADAPADETS